MLSGLVISLLLAATPASQSLPRIHTVAAKPQGLSVNGYLVEGPHAVVAVDSALTVSDAKALRERLDALGKPLAAVLLTHGHPDHYNGVAILTEGASPTPIYATAAVAKVIREYDRAKETQWKPVFGAEWPARRVFPNRRAESGAKLTIDGIVFVAHDLGAGESHADSYWELRGPRPAAFIGDVVLNGMHAYTTDGHTAAWLANIARLRRQLGDGIEIYPGHGPAGGVAMLAWQRGYLEAYRKAVQELRAGRPALDDAAKKALVERMKVAYPEAGQDFLIVLGADKVAAELAAE